MRNSLFNAPSFLLLAVRVVDRRYEVMPKLENFMFPVPPPEPPLNVAELFGSLFGKQHGLAGAHA